MDMPANMSEPESHFQFNLLKARQKVIRYFTATVNPDDTAAASPAEEQRMIRRIHGTYVLAVKSILFAKEGTEELSRENSKEAILID
uniref:Uncharacterized protein n=1 Tax=Vespula pensylvanica TaxID=30213 RepID=A0A834UBW8_VESPE|nr:hypothetical protein H0235_005696 [Vespula pensylvanica]